MYTNDLEAREIPLQDLYLDPNNPRFSDRPARSTVPDSRVVDDAVQRKAEERMQSYGVEELYESILRNGFLPLDRIVVRELSDNAGSYVVVEGNRRLAALRLLNERIATSEVDADDLDDAYLVDLGQRIAKVNCLVYTGVDSDIAWILQGIRHISGIRDWTPAQRAELVVKEKTERGLGLRAVGQMLGLSTQAVTRLYRGHKGLQQMLDDDEFGARGDKTYFTLFDEAYGKRVVRDWLGWSDDAEAYLNDDNRRMFYAWISKDPEHGEARRIHDPRQIASLGKILAAGRMDLIERIDSYDITIDEAKGRLDETSEQRDWAAEIARAKAALDAIPLTAIVTAREGLRDQLTELLVTITSLVDRLGATEPSGE